MLFLVLLSTQALNPLPVPPTGQIVTDPCAPGPDKDAIVICGTRDKDSRYRIGPLPPTPPTLPDATYRLGKNTNLSAEAEQGEVGGIPTNRAMVKLKIKF